MKNVAVVMFFCFGVLLFCCGCETYLGYHYEELAPEVREVEKSRTEKARYWQYQLRGKNLKLFHSAVSEVRFDVTRSLCRRRVDKYAVII